MSRLPVELLVENFAARQRCTSLPAQQGAVHALRIADDDWLGVTGDEEDGELILFCHPGFARRHNKPEAQAEEQHDDVEVGFDDDGRWLLRFDPRTGLHTLWTSLQHDTVGHAEFARVVTNMQDRFRVWKEILLAEDETPPAVADATQVLWA